MSSANRRLFSSTQSPPEDSSTDLRTISSKKTFKRLGDKTHSCLTPTLHRNILLNFAPTFTSLVDSITLINPKFPQHCPHSIIPYPIKCFSLIDEIQKILVVFDVLFARYLLRCTSSCSKTCLAIIQQRIHSWCSSLLTL